MVIVGPKQSWANNQIFKYIRIFWTNIFIRKNICWFFLDQINLDIYSWYFYHAEYIRIFIRPISMVTNIFGYSFVQKNYICPTLPAPFLVLPQIMLSLCFLVDNPSSPPPWPLLLPGPWGRCASSCLHGPHRLPPQDWHLWRCSARATPSLPTPHKSVSTIEITPWSKGCHHILPDLHLPGGGL